MKYVAVDREDLAELRRRVDRVAAVSPSSLATAVHDHLRGMEVLKLTAAVEREQLAGNLTFEIKENR